MSPLAAGVAMLIAVTLYGALHSWLASLSSKGLARRLFGPSADRLYRLMFNLIGTVTF